MDNQPPRTLTEFDDQTENWVDRELTKIMHKLKIMHDEAGGFGEIDDDKLDQIAKLVTEFKAGIEARAPDTHQSYFGTLHSAFEKSLYSFEANQIIDLLAKIKSLSLVENESGIVKEYVRLSTKLGSGFITSRLRLLRVRWLIGKPWGSGHSVLPRASNP